MSAHTQAVLSAVSGAFFGTVDTKNSLLTPLNSALKETFNDQTVHLDLMLKSNDTFYGAIGKIPVRLVSIVENDDDAGILVQVFLAQSKTSRCSTDFAQLADMATDGVWEWYPSLNYEYMSVRFWSILGYQQKDMEESPSAWAEKIYAEDAKLAMKLFEEHVMSKGEVPYYSTVRYRHKESKDVHVLCRGTVVEWLPDGSPWRMLGTHTDVTNMVLKDALESREKFVSRMSHEIRSPLCVVLNECDLLEEKYDLSVIKDSCLQILYIANDVLSLNKLKSDKINNDIERCDPEHVLAKAIKRHRGEFKKKGIRLSSSVGDVPLEILLDQTKFNQILDNVISNALKYTNSGRVSVDCDYDVGKSLLRTTVEDTGIGITAEEQPNIFNEFFQGKASMRGIGIGLHVVKTLCEFMGGYVKLRQSTLGVGTTMEFAVVAELASAAPLTEQETLKKKSLRVLVVDDIATNRKYLNRKLQDLEKGVGFPVSETVEASNGDDAIRIFEKSEDQFDLVLMDCLMPIMDGFEATKKIHEVCDKKNKERVPVVAVTASIAENIYDMCKDAGMICVVTKPFTVDDLRVSIDKAHVLD